jgi:uncharacterized SAM-dependent methyltransferase
MDNTKVVTDLGQKLRATPEEYKQFEDLLKSALSTRITVSDILQRVAGEKDEAVLQKAREDVEEIENRFNTEKGKFLNQLFLKGLEVPDFEYADMCNTMLP